MNDQTVRSVHWSFWLIASIGLLWNVLGAVNFVGQMNTDLVASMPDTHRAIIDGRPGWATVGFAVAVFAGTLGGILLLIRKSAAFSLFVVSLLGTILTMIHTFSIARSAGGFSLFEMVMMMVMPLLVAAFLIGYAKYSTGKGWIG